MLKITRLSDYAVAVMAQMATATPGVQTAKGLAARTGLPQPAVSKILKTLARSKLVQSHRGMQGGYRLAREASRVSVVEVIEAVEGPVALTDCGTPALSECEFQGQCSVQANWLRINQVVRRALANISIEDMILPPRQHRLIQLRRAARTASIEVQQRANDAGKLRTG